VSLTWTNTDPRAADISFQIERAPENGEPVVIPVQANLSPTGAFRATDAFELQEGVTFIYQVRALLGEVPPSDPSNQSRATVFPAAPVNLVATPVGINQINLSWTNASTIATDFSVERQGPGGAFQPIGGVRDATTYFDSDPSLVEGTPYQYRVFAIVAQDRGGVENNQPKDVISAASATAPATIAFTAAFTAPPGTLTTDVPSLEGHCVVQRLNQTLLTAGGTHQVRILLRGSTTGDLTLDKVTISQPAATGDPYDAEQDLTEVGLPGLPGVPIPIPQNTAVTVGPVDYVLDASQDLLIAFDISNTPGQGNGRVGALTGGDTFDGPGKAEAGKQDRTTGYQVSPPDNLFLVEIIEVL
jgi:hypothetical protein